MSNNNYCKDCKWVCGKHIYLPSLTTLRCKNYEKNGWWITPDKEAAIDKVSGKLEQHKGTYQLCTTARRGYQDEYCGEEGTHFERQNSFLDKIKPFNSWFIVMEVIFTIEMLFFLISWLMK
jgi:hypothetical protein